MSNSQFCIQQRQKEQQQLKKLLMFGLASSTVLHGILAYVLPRWSFESPQVVKEPIEMMIVDKPKPKLKPKVESKPIVEPKPTPVKPPPVQAQTSLPPVKPPEPVQAQTPPPKPVPKTPEAIPKKVLTTPTPAPSQPIVSAPVENTVQPSFSSSNITAPNSSSVTSTDSSSPDAPGSAVATNSAPPRPEASSEPAEGISCINNCEPEYPSALEGVEGSAGVKLTIDRNGNVIGAELATTDSNSQVNRQALLAARQMQFSSPDDSAASVRVKIDFTVEGSEYDREAEARLHRARREEQQSREQAKEQQEETARQEQLEAEQQARQERLERERQARQQQQQQQQQELTPPVPEAKPSPKPLPTLSPEELDEERLRKFQERMEN